jgi:ATP dependent DNA ligase-like protein
MKRCRWLKPRLIAVIDFLEWTLDNHLRHPKFIVISVARIDVGSRIFSRCESPRPETGTSWSRKVKKEIPAWLSSTVGS